MKQQYFHPKIGCWNTVPGRGTHRNRSFCSAHIVNEFVPNLFTGNLHGHAIILQRCFSRQGTNQKLHKMQPKSQ